MIYRFIYFPLIHRALYCFPQNTPRRSTVTLMKWSEEVLKLKPMRGKRVALKVSKEAPYKFMCEKAAVEKWKAYHNNLYDEDYVLLLDSCQEAIFLPGSAK